MSGLVVEAGSGIPKKKKRLRDQLRFDEYRRFADAFDMTFRQWLGVRKTQWYKDVKNGIHIKQWWEE